MNKFTSIIEIKKKSQTNCDVFYFYYQHYTDVIYGFVFKYFYNDNILTNYFTSTS